MSAAARPAGLPRRQVLAYAAPGLAYALFVPPFPAILATFYAMHTAVSAATIATVLLVTRISDAFVDVGIGYASDATRTRLGARKPWMIVGTLLGVAAFAVAFHPPPDAAAGYFVVAIVLYYLTIGTFDIPWRSWAGELATDYAERSRLAAYLTLTLLVGGVAFLLLPNLLALPALGIVETAEFDRRMMAVLGWVGMVALPLLVLPAVLFVPHQSEPRVATTPVSAMLRAARGNRPFRVLAVADVCTQLAWGITYGVLFIALDRYWGLGARVALLLLVATFAQILVVPVCMAAARRFGKHRTWGWSSILGAVAGMAFLLVPPDGQAHIGLVAALMAVVSALGTPNMIFPMAMVSDIADYDRLKSRENRNGSYYALRLLIYKAAFALGGSLGLYMLAAVGFDPRVEVHSEFARQGLLLTLVVLPNLLFVVAGIVLLRFPIDARRHAVIRRRIEAREVRSLRGSAAVRGAWIPSE
jgi:Na+/melibiose symporter-like transporter